MHSQQERIQGSKVQCSAKNKMLFCYVCRKLDFSPTQPLYPLKGGTKVPLPLHIMKNAKKYNLFFDELLVLYYLKHVKKTRNFLSISTNQQ